MLYRALVISNLVTNSLKNRHRKLVRLLRSHQRWRWCGAGICYLYGGHYDEIAHTIVNALAIIRYAL